MKILEIKEDNVALVIKYPQVFDGFLNGFPIDVVEVEELDGYGKN